MVVMPKEFVATRYPGYFWNVKTQTLFTAKLGVLREMKYTGPNRWNHYAEVYKVSHNGKRRSMSLDYLQRLKPTKSIFPVEYKLTSGQLADKIDLFSLPEGATITIRIS